MFQDSEIILREKILSDFQTNLSPSIAMRSKGGNSPSHVIREGGISLFGFHGMGTGSRVSLDSHCDAGVPGEVKIFLRQKIFQLFFKTGFLHVSGLSEFSDYFKGKIFFRLSDQSESRNRSAISKAETPLYM